MSAFSMKLKYRGTDLAEALQRGFYPTRQGERFTSTPTPAPRSSPGFLVSTTSATLRKSPRVYTTTAKPSPSPPRPRRPS